MNRIPDYNWRFRGLMRPVVSELDELGGWVELGHKAEALRLAREMLKAGRITHTDFERAVHALLTHGDKVGSWARLVEAAYARLPKRDQRAVRFWMLAFHNSSRDHAAASRFIPRRFQGEVRFVELAMAMGTLLALGRMDEAQRLARRFPRAIEEADHPVKRAQLLVLLAETWARMGKWDAAIAVAELAEDCETFSRNAVVAIVEIHVARALRALRHGFCLIEQFNGNFDPDAETTLPGNNRAIQEEAAKQFRRLQRILEGIVPKERQRELRVDG